MKGGGASNSSVASSNKTSTSSRHSQFGATDARKIHSLLLSVQRKVKSFKKKHLAAKSKQDTQSACAICLEEEILRQWKMQPEELKTFDEFLRLTLRKPLDESTVSSEAFIDLLGISEQAQDFERLIVHESKLKISILLETHVIRTFTSLKEEADGDNLKSVSEYDSLVQKYKTDIETIFASLEKHLASYEEASRPFLEYVKHGEEISSVMNQACNDLLAICKLVEAWLVDDEAYPGKLEEEMAKNSDSKEDLMQRLHQAHQRQESNKSEIERLQKIEEKSERQYFIHRREKRKLKFRLGDLEERKNYLENKISKLREDKEGLKDEITRKGPMTAREQYSVNIRMEELERLLDKLTEQSKLTDKQLKRVNRDLKPAMHTTYEHKVEAVTIRHNKENLQRENGSLDEDVKSTQQLLWQLDHNNCRLKRVRGMKVSGEAFRKNLRQIHRQEMAYSNGSHDLSEACKAAAPSIGKDWKKVYLCLPFDPPRDVDRLHRDVDILDHIAARNDVTAEGQALKSLEKWQAFNRKCDVMELIQALQQVKKKRLARDLQNRFVGVPV